MIVTLTPIQTQTTPPCSITGYAATGRLLANSQPFSSVGISTQLPFTSNFQP